MIISYFDLPIHSPFPWGLSQLRFRSELDTLPYSWAIRTDLLSRCSCGISITSWWCFPVLSAWHAGSIQFLANVYLEACSFMITWFILEREFILTDLDNMGPNSFSNTSRRCCVTVGQFHSRMPKSIVFEQHIHDLLVYIGHQVSLCEATYSYAVRPLFLPCLCNSRSTVIGLGRSGCKL